MPKKIKQIDKYEMVERDSFASVFLFGAIFDKINELVEAVNLLIEEREKGNEKEKMDKT